MSRRLRSIVAMGVLAGVTLAFYGARLGPPPPLSAGESALFQQAAQLASTGRDRAGRFAPTFFQVSEEGWLQPMAVFVTGGVLLVTSGGEGAARLAGALVAAVSAALIYLVAVRLLRHEVLGVLTAAILVLSPAMFAHARTASDALYVVPWVLLWMNATLAFIDRPRPWVLILAGLSLGAGMYAQPRAPITMALLALLTCVVLRVTGHWQARLLLSLAGGFVVPLALMAVWFVAHPETYPDTMGRWAIHQAHIRNPIDGLRAFVNWTTLGARMSLYWGFFDPSWLVFAVPERVGVLRGGAPFLLPTAILASVGAAHLLKRSSPSHALLLIGGTLIAPVAASTFGEVHNLGQAMTIVPMAVLCAGVGASRILERSSGIGRTAGIVVLGLLPIQFGAAYVAYFAP